MLVAYPLPGKGYRYPIWRGSGLYIAFQAFGDASIEIFSKIVPRFFYKPTTKTMLEVTAARKNQSKKSHTIMSSGAFLSTLYIGIILIYVIIGVTIGIVVSLIFRSYILWYFKINKRIKLQEETNRLLNEIVSKNISPSSTRKIERDYSAYMPK